ncbi:MAG: flagellar assembly peptidoglycan hydrolase FlgJ [Thiotrichales bacterium]
MQIVDKGLADVYTDFSGLSQLRHNAANHADAASKETAEQFEALFLQIMLKNMRATVGKGLLDSNQSEMAMDMYDKQLATTLAKKGSIGIDDLVLKQLGKTETISAELNQPTSTKTERPENAQQRDLSFARGLWNHSTAQVSEAVTPTQQQPLPWKNSREFIASLLPSAKKAAEKLGTKPEAVLAVAALETGWGKHVMKDQQGSPSNNLFGIKSSRDWADKPTTWAATLEFEGGIMRKKTEPFRQYQSIDESVMDFANFVQSNHRYTKALENADQPDQFLKELHKAGYATDPDYFEKVKSVMSRVKEMTQELV